MTSPMQPIPVQASIAQLSAALRAGLLTSEQLVQAQLARARRLDGQLHAFVELYADEALASARALDALRRAGTTLGPLHGVTVAVKDLFEIEGRCITGGASALPARRSTLDATVVRRLRAAGALLIGKTHTVEHAFGGWGTNATMGTPWNPWDLATHRVPGGSSSGSAVAVAAGMASAALGTDTGGSVRIPAGLCGLTGLKTTHGLISRHGLLELCPTHDTIGPLARSAEDAALLLDAMAGPDPADPVSRLSPVRRVAGEQLQRPVAGLRAWVLPAAERDHVAPEVLAAYDTALQAFQRLGLQLVERALPQPLAEAMALAGELMSAEGYAQLGPLYEREDLNWDPHVRRRILLGRQTSAARYQQLLKARAGAMAAMTAAMDGLDVCLFPTNAISAIPVAEVDELATPLSRLGRFVNWLDLCAVALPVGLSPQGLPVSLQVIGRPLAEPLILRVGHVFQQATEWHLAVPPGLQEAAA